MKRKLQLVIDLHIAVYISKYAQSSNHCKYYTLKTLKSQLVVNVKIYKENSQWDLPKRGTESTLAFVMPGIPETYQGGAMKFYC